MEYPKRVIKKNESDKTIVKAIQEMLNKANCGPIEADGAFGKNTESAVKLFQTRHVDVAGNALVADGEVGAVTWAILFGDAAVENNNDMPSDLLANALVSAISQINVIEVPLGSNRGPQVNLYLKSVGLNALDGHYAWCAAFVYWNFNEAAKKLNIENPLPCKPGVLDQWNLAKKAKKILQVNAINDPSLIRPGSIFAIDHGGGLGHMGIVERVNGGNLTTIEGNTNNGQSREGYGVFRLTTRKINDINLGFLEY